MSTISNCELCLLESSFLDFFIKRYKDGVLPLESALLGCPARLMRGLSMARFTFELLDEVALPGWLVNIGWSAPPKIMLAELSTGEDKIASSTATEAFNDIWGIVFEVVMMRRSLGFCLSPPSPILLAPLETERLWLLALMT